MFKRSTVLNIRSQNHQYTITLASPFVGKLDPAESSAAEGIFSCARCPPTRRAIEDCRNPNYQSAPLDNQRNVMSGFSAEIVVRLGATRLCETDSVGDEQSRNNVYIPMQETLSPGVA